MRLWVGGAVAKPGFSFGGGKNETELSVRGVRGQSPATLKFFLQFGYKISVKISVFSLLNIRFSGLIQRTSLI